MVNEKTQEIDLKGKSKISFFLIHGYTGSVTDFNELPEYLNKKYDADVKVVRLKGHQERIEKLDDLEYRDFFQQIRRELEKEISKGNSKKKSIKERVRNRRKGKPRYSRAKI